ncbi:MAG: DUF2189 domain-containing protein [Pseudomonadales bacterium]|nr:DUF2189 domain-containing protein [Pseudomonadales bacterium]
MDIPSHHEAIYPIANVPLTRPFVWLAEAWQDLLHHRSASLAYGFIVSALGMVIITYERHPFFLAAAIAAFMVMGPIMAAGVCELSRCRDKNQPSDFDSSLNVLLTNRSHLLGVANRLFLICAAWFVASYLLIWVAIGSVAPPIEQTVWGDVMYSLSTAQVFAYGMATTALAIVVFVCSVVTVPMIIDHHVDAKTAIQTSVRVASKDLPAMIIWAMIIATLTAIAFATYLVAMIVIFPLLGHATWYAYKDLVKD